MFSAADTIFPTLTTTVFLSKNLKSSFRCESAAPDLPVLLLAQWAGQC
uniref:Uncharacterized protein n=1 Tax=Anguilla anguilla TaxID=7936 RepID=A0A0E9W319_ANGAN